MLNSRTSKLDQILNMGQFMYNQNGIGYSGITDLVATMSNTVFVKVAAETKNTPVLVRILI